MPASLSIKDSISERRQFAGRSLALFVVATVLVMILVGRLVQLQIFEYAKYRTRSDENRIQVEPLAPPRGLIYDRHGVLLADNRPQLSLSIVRERVSDFDAR